MKINTVKKCSPVIVALIASLAAFLASCTSHKNNSVASENIKNQYHAAEVEKYLGTLSSKKMPGFAYLISKDGKIVAKGGVGLANIESNTPNDTQTVFRAASITKQFTAVSILLLVEQGRLSLDDKLNNYFPALPNAEKITIRSLLDHTSGMWEQEKDEDFPFPVDQEVPANAHLSYIQKNKPYFEPGEKWNYCNNGYFVLGLIVEKIAGMPLESYMQKHLFSPLGMKNSGLYGNNAQYKYGATGYGIRDEKPYQEIDTNMFTYKGAAALYSTVEDLLLWSEALHNGKIISSESYQQLITPHKFTNGFVPFVGYGFGVGIEDVGGRHTIGHPGRMYGFQLDMLRIPEDNINVIFLANVNSGQLKAEGRVAATIIETLYRN
ncbi:serine hydrolase domain-containing protein [Cellvibrio sp. OA-2007]|uniref:serine hydrolase domain-containing protein n=1 Tax=Cellvibrio sp. OA-2007 TaxID=529823 RepID=UPI0007864677|nr:serine hydrolase domain-containing protein [Cellvibrio sp. OA-2007]